MTDFQETAPNEWEERDVHRGRERGLTLGDRIPGMFCAPGGLEPMTTNLPLPWGEGWGEGKGSVRVPKVRAFKERFRGSENPTW